MAPPAILHACNAAQKINAIIMSGSYRGDVSKTRSDNLSLIPRTAEPGKEGMLANHG